MQRVDLSSSVVIAESHAGYLLMSVLLVQLGRA